MANIQLNKTVKSQRSTCLNDSIESQLWNYIDALENVVSYYEKHIELLRINLELLIWTMENRSRPCKYNFIFIPNADCTCVDHVNYKKARDALMETNNV